MTKSLNQLGEARKALSCLYLAVDESIAKDVEQKVEAAFLYLAGELIESAKKANEPSEMLDNKDAFHYAWQAWLYATDTMQMDRDAALRKGIEAYFYHSDHYAPKPVSLARCAKAVEMNEPKATNIARAVLDAAGVKYHE